MKFLFILMLAASFLQQPEPELRTFVFVRSLEGAVEGANVVFAAGVETWIFPRTNEGGWTKRQVPDDSYTVTVSADGFVTRVVRDVKIPQGVKFPHRDIIIWLKRPAKK